MCPSFQAGLGMYTLDVAIWVGMLALRRLLLRQIALPLLWLAACLSLLHARARFYTTTVHISSLHRCSLP